MTTSSPASPDAHSAPVPDLADHRLLGDGAGAALVRPDAGIDWWCAPFFDSPPVLWSLLDPAGAQAVFRGAGAVGEGHHDRPAGPTTTTTVRIGGRAVTVRDGYAAGRLIRLVHTVGGPLDVVHDTTLGGFGAPGGPARPVETLLRLDPADALEITPTGVAPLDPAVAAARLDAAEAAFASEVDARNLPANHPERITHALEVMWACTDTVTGGTVAAPTTSLPEALGGDRQFDYRYAWLRDGSLAASVAVLVGRGDLAAGHLRFLRSLGPRIFDAPVFTVGGRPVPDEEIVEHVAGWAGSRPIRTGNAAKGQVQFDALGFVVDAVAASVAAGGKLDRALWSLVRQIADRAAAWDDEPTSGIWEFRTPRWLVCADIGRWIALDRALRLARRRRPWTPRRHWVAARNHCRKRVLAELRPDGRLPQVYGGSADDLDASALLIPMYGLLDGGDPRAARLVDAHLEGLGDGPFLYRYAPGGDDGFAGREGAFIPCSWWAVSALARTGRHREAQSRADALCAALPALLPEEIDPATGASVGNVPLVWSHMECARALYLLEQGNARGGE